LPVGDCAIGFLDQEQAGGDVPGVDEAVVVQADAAGRYRQGSFCLSAIAG